ncbi:hypothetical protein JTB14_014098 [Gonioctena quinquepunctata]|nr:hypothetical protein JTB14_014098 [Gonioctena quinquepunctata]
MLHDQKVTILLCGDFNFPNNDWEFGPNCSFLVPTGTDRRYNVMNNVIGFYNFMQCNHIMNPNGKIFDSIVCNEICIRKMMRSKSPIRCGRPSSQKYRFHRHLLSCEISKLQRNPRAFRKANNEAINGELEKIEWVELFESNHFMDIFYEQIHSIMDKLVQKKKIEVFHSIKMIEDKNRAHKNWKNTIRVNDYIIFSQLSRKTKRAIQSDNNG